MAEVIIQNSRKMYGNSSDLNYHFCEQILYIEIGNSRIKAWDVIIFVPNLLFLLLLIARFNRARLKLRATSSPIFITFYGLVLVNVLISLIRCCVSMTLSAAMISGGYTDKILWVIVRFFMLSTEMCVVIFGLAFGHLDSRSSIRYVLLATSFISLAFSITQGTLEVISPDTFTFGNNSVFKHGGMLFWFITSFIFAIAYFLVLILPWTKLRERIVLPTRHSFYLYIFFLALLDVVQTIGSGLLYYGGYVSGLCMVDATSCIYFTMFTPLVFHAFLNEFFSITQPTIMFSYKAQVDDAMEEDNVSLPHQQSFSSLKTDSDCIYQSNNVYDSTHFDNRAPVNPLYAASLQSPDSIAGYSIDSSSSLDASYQQNGNSQPH
ncbi:Integral membrane protein GPR175, putative [Pediculus humanus corporis]|uniref:Integral membrane protein GPR175, putative n=1 Tax=Pediculus humanus subsp. corporis TaxID=121224 RepID=E0VAR4_PEDHC|nr:Integral membrane protein GPR175, putative [Pediculus humanus corporis]EEB10470.1 Integral membrane protein GPR175, putative [Pediculus humanus corporis]